MLIKWFILKSDQYLSEMGSSLKGKEQIWVQPCNLCLAEESCKDKKMKNSREVYILYINTHGFVSDRISATLPTFDLLSRTA